jgi:D-alanine-D-alanine ligase-like ATP-grasp enzyme
VLIGCSNVYNLSKPEDLCYDFGLETTAESFPNPSARHQQTTPNVVFSRSGRNRRIVRKAFVSEILIRVAPAIGASIELEPDYGFVGSITFKSGKRVLFKDRNFNINPQGSSEIARDKGYTSYFLRTFGYQVPTETTVFTEKYNDNLAKPRDLEDGWQFAKSIGLPVILKPNNLSQGTLVAKVHTKREFFSQAKRILRRSSVLVIQEYVTGADYRIVVLDDEVISAYERTPLCVVGDGNTSIRELLIQKQDGFVASGRDTRIEIEDPRIRAKLRHARLTIESIPETGAVVPLLDVANLSTGGDARDVTDSIHKDYIELAVNITKDFGLRLCGVDLLSRTPISCPLKDYAVLEINSAPGLDNYASIGLEQESRVDTLYLKVLKALEASI